MANSQKLELNWFGKQNEIRIEPRILIEDASKSINKKGINENLLIHGDNLLALKSLEKEYSGKIKCIYIDPPYNTGSAFEHYDDNLEHSIWLGLMYPRIKILHNLLSSEGTFWIQIDYNEFAYLKVMLDEIFGRSNFITCITVKAKAPGGVGQESYIFDLCEYILVYRKSDQVAPNNVPYLEESLGTNITDVYNKIIPSFGEERFVKTISGGNVGDISVYEFDNYSIKTISKSDRNEAVYFENYETVFRTTNPQGGLMKRVMPQLPKKGLCAIEYIPSKGRNAGEKYRYFFYDGSLIVWLKDTAVKDSGRKKVLKLIRNNNLWIDNLHQGIAKEGGVDFQQSKKPEKLIERVLSIATNPGDIVLDSFLGSGTTSAVAHKMGRRWIGIEMGEHAYTHCKVRLDDVISGKDQSGISKDYNWKGGGGYRFLEVAPTLIKKDSFGQDIINPEYNAEMLAFAVARHEGFSFEPSEKVYWKQAKSDENSFLFITTKHMSREFIESISQSMAEGEFLLIVCRSYDASIEKSFKNIRLKKIPQSLLRNCEFGVENYNLNIVNPPTYQEDVMEEEGGDRIE